MNANTVWLTILSDNTAKAPLLGEHGFSVLLETIPGGTVLFDVGMGAVFKNAPLLGKDLTLVAHTVLSHGHYDHTDALGGFLSSNQIADIYASHGVLNEHYSMSTGTCRKIGVSDSNRKLIQEMPAHRLRLCKGMTDISGTPFTVAEDIIRLHPLEKTNSLLFQDPECRIPDPVQDELVLWFRARDGLVILTGCCHSGFINTCEEVRRISGVTEIAAVIGGFHLKGVSPERLQATADYIREKRIIQVIPCHCTGLAETKWLRAELGSTITSGFCGFKTTFQTN